MGVNTHIKHEFLKVYAHTRPRARETPPGVGKRHGTLPLPESG